MKMKRTDVFRNGKTRLKYNIYIGYGYISRKIADIITLMLLLIILENNMQL